MRKQLSILILLAIFLSPLCAIRLRGGDGLQPAPKSEKKTEVVDVTADVVYPKKIDDTTEVYCLVGNFAAQHNGAVITADSAVRYSDRRLVCFGNVLINKNTTYAYADRAEYNGETNEAVLHAPIVKVVDQDAVLYTYNFTFNTKTNIGFYTNGGVMTNGEDLVESVDGYFNSDTKELIGVGDVQLRGDQYLMSGDSVIYNTDTEFAQFFTNTNIWNEEDDYLFTDQGSYEKKSNRYTFTKNGYILTPEQEVFSDSMDYYRQTEYVVMRQNIQFDDTTHKSLAFGNYGEYWKDPGNITMTNDPLIINYDPQQGDDSLFMRADTILVLTKSAYTEKEQPQDSVATEQPTASAEQPLKSKVDSEAQSQSIKNEQVDAEPKVADAKPREVVNHQDIPIPDTSKRASERPVVDNFPVKNDSISVPEVDSVLMATDSILGDSLVVDSLAADSVVVDSVVMMLDTMSFMQKVKYRYNIWNDARLERKAVRDAERKVRLDSIGKIRAAKRAEKYAEQQKRHKHHDGCEHSDADSLPTDSIAEDSDIVDSVAQDSVSVDSLLTDSLAVDSMVVDTIARDSVYRLIIGLKNARTYRSDFQSVGDSIVTNSQDSTIRLYINPVLWYENSQVVAGVMDVYTAFQEIVRAEFNEKPMMTSQIVEGDTTHINQVAGKTIITLFKDQEAYRTDVDGNAQTIYFMQDENTHDITGMMVMESGSTTFYIVDQTVEGITYRTKPDFVVYPMDKIPAEQPLHLDGFKWEADRRPTHDQLLNREIRPTQRQQKSELERPQFPLTEELEQVKKELIEDRVWIDRHDLVDARTEEWLNSLGYKSGQPRENAK